MINFVIPSSGCYATVIKAFVDPILPHLDRYEINNKAKDNMVNVIFFTEDSIFKNVDGDKTNGINIFMTHGIADKNWRTAKVTNKFDYVFVTGDLWVDKLVKQGMDRNKILVNGYTRLEETYNKKDTYIKKCVNKRTILFAPTHNTCISTLNKYDDIIDTIKDKYNIIISSHPANRDNKEVTSDQFLEADVVVGDFGSSMYEAWTLGKPCVFGDWLLKEAIHNSFRDSFEDYIYQNDIGYHSNTKDEFIELLEVAIDNGIKDNSKEFIDGIFNKELRSDGGRITAEQLINISKKLKE